MLKKLSYSMFAATMLTTISGINLSYADENSNNTNDTQSKKGTMGYGYQQYMKKLKTILKIDLLFQLNRALQQLIVVNVYLIFPNGKVT
jgi:hypothetical protein